MRGIDLPTLVRSFPHEPPIRRLGSLVRSGNDLPTPHEHPPDRGLRRHIANVVCCEPCLHRRRTAFKTIVDQPLTRRDDPILELGTDTTRRPLRGPRPILKPSRTFEPIPRPPLVRGLTANPELPTPRSELHPVRQRRHQHLHVHRRHLCSHEPQHSQPTKKCQRCPATSTVNQGPRQSTCIGTSTGTSGVTVPVHSRVTARVHARDFRMVSHTVATFVAMTNRSRPAIVTLRMSRSLRDTLHDAACAEGCSLNGYAVQVLASAVGDSARFRRGDLDIAGDGRGNLRRDERGVPLRPKDRSEHLAARQAFFDAMASEMASPRRTGSSGGTNSRIPPSSSNGRGAARRSARLTQAHDYFAPMRTDALVFSAAHTCEVASYDLPEELGRGEVLLRNRLGLISPGTELAIFYRDPPRLRRRGPLGPVPLLPGLLLGRPTWSPSASG